MNPFIAGALLALLLGLAACADSATYEANERALQHRDYDCPGGYYPPADAAGGLFGSGGMQCADPTMPEGSR
jgi:hypothetical protein